MAVLPNGPRMSRTVQVQPTVPTGLAPVAVFAYKRPDRLAALMQSLEQCEGFAQSPVTIFVDGPRNEADRAAVNEARVLVTRLAYPNVSQVISETNRGLRDSIFDGVSRLVEEHGRVIVLEDDLVLSPIALSFFNEALDYYADDSRVWSISGYISDVRQLRDFPRALILPYAHSWGWATWSRTWRQFDLNARPRDENLRAASFRQAMDVNGFYPFRFTLARSIAGHVDSWYAHWLYTIVREGGRSVFPPRRVIDNYGISAGTHGGRFNPHERLVKRPPLLECMPEFADAGEIDYFAADLLKKCWEARVQRLIPYAGALKRRISGVRRKS
jgi:hypothetical protein